MLFDFSMIFGNSLETYKERREGRRILLHKYVVVTAIFASYAS